VLFFLFGRYLYKNKNMDEKKKNLLELKNKFEKNVNLFKNLKIKQISQEISEKETERLKEIETELDSVMEQPKTLSALPTSTNLAIGKMKDINNNFTNIIEHTPVTQAPKTFINNKWLAVDTNETTLLAKYEKVSNNMAIGTTKDTFGVVDDLLNYTGRPTLKLEKLWSSNNNDIISLTNKSEIGDQYSISFIFRLNRFPSKAHIISGFVKRIITRRTDLLAFEYASPVIDGLGGCKIEFGAMAPYGRYNTNQQQIDENGAMDENSKINEQTCLEYKNQYSPFSIAANITNENFAGSTSIYTDYKFELGKDYHVTLLISKTNMMNSDPFGSIDDYIVSLSVDNVVENTAIVSGKVWGSSFNGNKARKPLFYLEGSSEYLRKIDMKQWGSIDSREAHQVKLGFLNIRELKTITSPPNIIKTNNNGDKKMFIPNTFKSNKSIIRKHLYKINNGVDIGAINISTSSSKRKNPKTQ
jgi:hypothetical protein